MIHLALWIVSFVIVAWAIIAGLVVLRALFPIIMIATGIFAIWYLFAHLHDPGLSAPFFIFSSIPLCCCVGPGNPQRLQSIPVIPRALSATGPIAPRAHDARVAAPPLNRLPHPDHFPPN